MKTVVDYWVGLHAPWPARRSGIVVVDHTEPAGTYHQMIPWGSIRRSRALASTRTYPQWEWYLLICNNPECDGQVWIREDRLTEAVERAVVASAVTP